MIFPGQLRAYAAALMPENNTIANVGGAIDLTTAIDFSIMSQVDQLQIVSSSSLDTAVSVTIYGRLASGMIVNETDVLNGQTPVPTTQNAWNRIMKAAKSGTSVGDIAIEQVTPVRIGTLIGAGSSTDQVVLDSGASSVDGTYVGNVLRITSGTGHGTIAKIFQYVGSTKTAYLDKQVTIDNTSAFLISNGTVFLKSPNEILNIHRMFYGATADVASGSLRTYYEKFFWENDSSQTLLVASVVLAQGFLNNAVSFAVDPILPSTSTAANRLTLPSSSLTFGIAPQSVPNNQLLSGQSVGVWVQFMVPAGQSPQNSDWLSGLSGQTL